MSQIDPEGRPKGGQINVKVEPSAHIGDGKTGVFVNVNDHYAKGDDQPDGAEGVIGLLERNFETSIDRSNRLIDHIMSLARHQGA